MITTLTSFSDNSKPPYHGGTCVRKRGLCENNRRDEGSITTVFNNVGKVGDREWVATVSEREKRRERWQHLCRIAYLLK
jgi:hypothetical protein